jgi:hypothetical protein
MPPAPHHKNIPGTRFPWGLPLTSTHALKEFVHIVAMSFGNGVFDLVQFVKDGIAVFNLKPRT